MTNAPVAEYRVSVRVEPSLYSGLKRIADERYEGRWAMAAREAFRLLIAQDKEEAA